MRVKCRRCFKRGQVGVPLDQRGFLPSQSDSTTLLQFSIPTSSSQWGWACSGHACTHTCSVQTQPTTRVMHTGNQCLYGHHINTNSTHINMTSANGLILFLCISKSGCLLLGHAYTCTHNLPIYVQKWFSPVADPQLWSSPQQTLGPGLCSVAPLITFPHWFHFCDICT